MVGNPAVVLDCEVSLEMETIQTPGSLTPDLSGRKKKSLCHV
jgi:hypothetical protein